MHCVTPDDLSADGLRMMLVILASTVPSFRAKRLSLPTVRISVNVTAHFANNVTGGFTRLRGV